LVTAPEPDCWLHPDVEVRASEIEGKGLFALSHIPAGTAVSRVGGRLVTGAELQAAFDAAASDPTHPYIDTITVDGDLHLILPPRRPTATAITVATRTCGGSTPTPKPPVATSPPGEELTNDYATSTGIAEFRMDCACGSSLCRGTVTGTDWQRLDLQQRYGDHWTPGLLTLIRASQRPTVPRP
jgi:hypothetical protein